MYKKIVSLLFALFAVIVSYGQWGISGIVTHAGKQPAAMINVVLVKAGSGNILSFAATNKKGEYSLSYKGAFFKDSFAVQLQAFGFARQKTIILSLSQQINFTTYPETTELPKVTVQSKPKPLRAQGDTITYNVEKFSNPTDRVIGDVIKKLPGVEMDVNGKITYQGKPISRFYIDGDNLLDDKYNIATTSVPSNMIVSIQVLDKHQPIKALENVQYNEAPAMNIITKESARKKLINDGNAAIGTPSLYDLTLNTLFFSKWMKFINYLKLNNAGVDLNKEVISHNTSDNQKKIDNQPSSELLSINQAGSPGLAKKRYLFNNSSLLNINDLVNLSSGIQLRINAYYLNDKQYQTYSRATSFYLPSDTIRYVEDQNSRYSANTLRTQMNLNINNNGYYLNNTLVLENQVNEGRASLISNASTQINQHISGSNTNFSNEFNIIKVLANKRVIELYSYLENDTHPQTLSIEPGLYNNLVNQGKDYNGFNQQVSIPGFFTTSYFTLRKKYGIFTNTSQIGFSSHSQRLLSNIQNFQTDGSIHQLTDSFSNHVYWQRYKLYAQQEFEFKSDRLQISFSFPFNYQQISYHDPLHAKSDSSAHLIPFNPSFQLRLLSGRENSIIFSTFFDNSLARIDDVSKGFIFTNYRNIYSHDALFRQLRNKGGSLSYFFKKTIDGLFANFSVLYINLQKNVLENTFISNSIQQTGSIYYDNNASYQSFSASINKYIFNWKTDIKLGFLASQQLADQLQNGKLLRFRNNSYSYKLKIDSKLPGGIYAYYTGVITKSSNKQLDNNDILSNSQPKATQFEQQIELSMVVTKHFYVKVNADDYYNSYPGASKNHFIFLDANATIQLKKLNSDIQLFVNNIIGNNAYTTLNLSSNIISENRYSIRPRTIMIKFNYRF